MFELLVLLAVMWLVRDMFTKHIGKHSHKHECECDDEWCYCGACIDYEEEGL